MTHDLQLLKALVIDNPDLDRLKTILAQFNITTNLPKMIRTVQECFAT